MGEGQKGGEVQRHVISIKHPGGEELQMATTEKLDKK